MPNTLSIEPVITSSAVRRSAPSILIVEDQDLIQELLLTVFNHSGFGAKEAGTVTEALARLDPPPDFCILDLHLPDGCGNEVLARIRQHGLSTRVAVTTGAIDPAILAETTRLKPECFFQKPYNAMDLVAWVRGGGARSQSTFPILTRSSTA